MKKLSSRWIWMDLEGIAAQQKGAIADGPFGSNLKTSDYVQSGVPVLQGKNITNDKFKWFDIRFITEQKAEELKRSKVRINDILLVKIGSIGYSAIVDNLGGYEFAIIPANLAKITINSNIVNINYLQRWLTSEETKRYLTKNASKTAQPALSLTKIKKLPIPLPPLDEQKRIAEVLDKADALREKRRLALNKLDRLLQSVFLEMFGDPVKNPKGWDLKTLQELSKFSQGVQVPFENQLLEKQIGYERFLRISDYTAVCERRFVKHDDKYFIKKDDIVVVRYGASAGFVGMGLEGILANNLFKINFDKYLLNSIFLFHFLHTQKFKLFIKNIVFGAAMPALNFSTLNKFEILLPPLKLQNKFVEIVEKIETLKAKQRNALANVENLFQSFQQKAFKGELFSEKNLDSLAENGA